MNWHINKLKCHRFLARPMPLGVTWSEGISEAVPNMHLVCVTKINDLLILSPRKSQNVLFLPRNKRKLHAALDTA